MRGRLASVEVRRREHESEVDMALPEDPNRQQREIENRRIANQREGAGWAAWWWIWVLIIIGIIWFGGWGWGGYGGWWWGHRMRAGVVQPAYNNGTVANGANGGVQNTALPPTGQGVAALTATNKQAYVGQPFDVRNVIVEKKVNDHALWVGESNGSNSAASNAGTGGNADNSGPSMLVVLFGNGNNAANANIAQGDRVTVTGTIEKAPAQNQAKKEWKLSEDGAKTLQRDGAYVKATQVELASAAPGQR